MRIRWMSVACAAAMLVAANVGVASRADAETWAVELTLSNAGQVTNTLTFGVDPSGSAGVDAALGEIELPPWPPSTAFASRFIVDGTNGLALDVRDDAPSVRLHRVRWQPGSGGYPIVIAWDRTQFPRASLRIRDAFSGQFLAPTNMYDVDQVTIGSELSFLREVVIEVIPGVSPGVAPVMSQPPRQRVYAGQRFAPLILDDWVLDLDSVDADLSWAALVTPPLSAELTLNRELWIRYPDGWIGTAELDLTVVDVDGLGDMVTVEVEVAQGGVVDWRLPIEVAGSGGDRVVLTIGMSPGASEGIDTQVAESALPPWPPTDVFDARTVLPPFEESLGALASLVDVRGSATTTATYRLTWQAGSAGLPVTLSWPAITGSGRFVVADIADSTGVPPFDMKTASSIVIDEAIAFVDALRVEVSIPFDQTAPTPPGALIVDLYSSDEFVDLSWTPSFDDNFDYYEIVITSATDPTMRVVSDRIDNSSLGEASTQTARVPLVGFGSSIVVMIRAWDTIGNVSEWSQSFATSTDAPPVPGRLLMVSIAPNPFNPQTEIQVTLARRARVTVDVFDFRGRHMEGIWRGELGAGTMGLKWSGRSRGGERVASGSYLCRVVADGEVVVGRMTLVR